MLAVCLWNNPEWKEAGRSPHGEVISHLGKLSYSEILVPGTGANTFPQHSCCSYNANKKLCLIQSVGVCSFPCQANGISILLLFVNDLEVLGNSLNLLFNQMLISVCVCPLYYMFNIVHCPLQINKNVFKKSTSLLKCQCFSQAWNSWIKWTSSVETINTPLLIYK